MIYEEREVTKFIKDPLFSSVKKYLENQLALIIAEGNEEKIKIAKQRYEGLTYKDVQIEPDVKFPNNKMISCFWSRKTGFFHADAELGQVTFEDILKDFDIVVIQLTKQAMLDAIKGDGLNSDIYYLTDVKEYVLVLSDRWASVDGIFRLLDKVFWYQIQLRLEDVLNPVTKQSGFVKLKSNNIPDKTLPIYYKPHIVNETPDILPWPGGTATVEPILFRINEDGTFKFRFLLMMPDGVSYPANAIIEYPIVEHQNVNPEFTSVVYDNTTGRLTIIGTCDVSPEVLGHSIGINIRLKPYPVIPETLLYGTYSTF